LKVGTDAVIYQDFRVRRHAIQQWLEYLVQHHPTFQSRQVTVDYNRLNQLPVDGSVHDRLRTMENEQMEDAFLNTGPPEATDDAAPKNQTHYSRQVLCQICTIDRLKRNTCRQAAFQVDEPVILTMPSMRVHLLVSTLDIRLQLMHFQHCFPLERQMLLQNVIIQ